MILYVERLPHAKDLPLPAYQTEGAAGMDLYAAIAEKIPIHPGEVVKVPTGFKVEIHYGGEGQIRPRSSLGASGIIIPNAPGTIDRDYRGEVKVLLMNLNPNTVRWIHPADRIAQLIISPVVQLPIKEVEKLSETARGHGGFGSTGR